MDTEVTSYKTKAVQFGFMFFGIVVALISATTSFSFFATYFSTIIPSTVLDPQIGRLVSGLMGVTLFDLATIVWLYTFLHVAETSEQRAISLAMIVVTFLGAASASVAYLSLSATGAMALDATSLQTIGSLSLIVVLIGIVLNFGAMLAFTRYSRENKQLIVQSDFDEVVERMEIESKKQLLLALKAQVTANIAPVAKQLAKEQATQMLRDFRERERPVGKHQYENPQAINPHLPVTENEYDDVIFVDTDIIEVGETKQEQPDKPASKKTLETIAEENTKMLNRKSV